MTLDDFLPGFWLPPICWSDIDLEGRTIRWRAEHEKTGHEHRTPVTAQALDALEEARRRKFASDLMNQPLKVLCELGGWKTAQTVLQCYQRADEDQLRKPLEDRRRVSIPVN